MLSWGVINDRQPLRRTLCTISKLWNLTDGFLLTTKRMDNCVDTTNTIVDDTNNVIDTITSKVL